MKPIGVNVADSSQIGKFKGIATVILILSVVVIAFIILNKFLRVGSGAAEAVGLKDSAEEKKNAASIKTTVNTQTTKGSASYWSPKYFQILNIPSGITKLNQAGIDKVVEMFWDSVGYVYDSPAKGLAAVKQVTSGYQLSQVANGFSQKYGLDLLGWMENKYDTEEQKRYLVEILKYAAQLKSY